MFFEIKVGRLLKVGIERRRPQKAVELEMANAILSRWNLAGCRNDVEAGLIEHDSVGLDLPLLWVLSRGLILGANDPLVHDRPVDRTQNSMLPLVALGRQAADVEHLPVRFVMLPNRRG